jgi:hypothetical protein
VLLGGDRIIDRRSDQSNRAARNLIAPRRTGIFADDAIDGDGCLHLKRGGDLKGFWSDIALRYHDLDPAAPVPEIEEYQFSGRAEVSDPALDENLFADMTLNVIDSDPSHAPLPRTPWFLKSFSEQPIQGHKAIKFPKLPVDQPEVNGKAQFRG